MTKIWLLVVAAVALSTSAVAAPRGGGFPTAQDSVARVRLVCDQLCDCWRTKYQERRRDAALVGPSCPRGGHPNYYYRMGTASPENPVSSFVGLFPLGFPYQSW